MEAHKYHVSYDIVYDEGKRDCHFNNVWKSSVDLYVPEQTCSGHAPIVLFVHGGGWRRGDKAAWKYFISRDINLLAAIVYWMYGLYGNVGKALARRGIACAVMSYPLTQLSTKWLLLELTTSYISSLFVFGVLLGICIVFMSGFNILSDLSTCSRTLLAPVIITNIVYLVIISIQYKYYRLSVFKISSLWILLFSLVYLAPSHYVLYVSALVSFMISQGILLQTNLNVLHLTLEEQMRSVAKCMRKIKDIGSETRSFDPNHLFLMGHSAGGHLCSILALSEPFLLEEGLAISDIKVHSLYTFRGNFINFN